MSPIFVIGTPRSGTTLTAKILGRHSQLFMPGETHFFPDIYSRRGEFGDPPTEAGATQVFERLNSLYHRYNESDDQARIERLFTPQDSASRLLMACRQGYRPALEYFMETQMLDCKKLRWGNNAPRDLFHVHDILALYPDARFIGCIRDVRDFLYSYQGKWKVTREGNVDRLKLLYHPVVTSLLWKSSMRRLMRLSKSLGPKRFAILRYEDLVTNPEASVRAICDTVGVPFEAGMLQVESHNSSTAIKETGIFATSVGRWRYNLTPEETKIAQQLTKTEMRFFGYQPIDVGASIPRILRLYAEAPWRLWRALKANAELTGPLMPYLAKRVGALVRFND